MIKKASEDMPCGWPKCPGIKKGQWIKFFNGKWFHESCFEVNKFHDLEQSRKELNRREIPWNLIDWD